MYKPSETLSKTNVRGIISEYMRRVESLGSSIANLKGLQLLDALKRGAVGSGPYPNVTLFEAANRIMTDLVILHGVKWLLDNDVFPFDSYMVEYGIENTKGFDIRATAGGKTLIGEAFNVAPSFFQSKKCAMLKKLRSPTAVADFKIIMVNHDAVQANYAPKCQPKEFFVVVETGTSVGRVVPKPAPNNKHKVKIGPPCDKGMET
jgi:hypothetical protein